MKERRSALIGEFDRIGASILQSMDLLDRDAAAAAHTLGIAIAADGREPLSSAAFVAETGVAVNVRTRSAAGVAIVEIDKGKVSRARTSRGFSLIGTSARTDAVANAFEVVIDRLLDVAGTGAFSATTCRRDCADDTADECAGTHRCPTTRGSTSPHLPRLGGAGT